MNKKILVLLIFVAALSAASAQEICDNGVDDDGDFRVDYFDASCVKVDSIYVVTQTIENEAFPVLCAVSAEANCFGARVDGDETLCQFWGWQAYRKGLFMCTAPMSGTSLVECYVSNKDDGHCGAPDDGGDIGYPPSMAMGKEVEVVPSECTGRTQAQCPGLNPYDHECEWCEDCEDVYSSGLEAGTCVEIGQCESSRFMCRMEMCGAACDSESGCDPEGQLCDLETCTCRPHENSCVDSLDNDGDGKRDCEDEDCAEDCTGCLAECQDAAVCKPRDEVCANSLDDDCDGRYDGEDASCIKVLDISSPSQATENAIFNVDCDVTAEANCIGAAVGEDDCALTSWPYQNKARFDCSATQDGDLKVSCYISSKEDGHCGIPDDSGDIGYPQGTQVLSTINVLTSVCAERQESQCNGLNPDNPDCEWCEDCQGILSSGLEAGTCVDLGECPDSRYSCRAGVCGAACDNAGGCDPAGEICNTETCICEDKENYCQDGLDNDDDQKVDCLDPDCQASEGCNGCISACSASVCKPREEVCDNLIDDDCDGLIDSEDAKCTHITGISAPSTPVVQGAVFEVECTSTVTSNCVGAKVGDKVDSCNFIRWYGLATSIFHCTADEAGDAQVTCYISNKDDGHCGVPDDRGDVDYPNASSMGATIRVLPSDCLERTQDECTGEGRPADCEWCVQCDGVFSNGLGKDSCVPIRTCEERYSCESGSCGSACDLDVGCAEPSQSCNTLDCTCGDPEVDCEDGIDNDEDGDTDCDDLDCQETCQGVPACTTADDCIVCGDTCIPREMDIMCTLQAVPGLACRCQEVCIAIETLCNDYADNDGDGDTDCSDADCAREETCGETAWNMFSADSLHSGYGPDSIDEVIPPEIVWQKKYSRKASYSSPIVSSGNVYIGSAEGIFKAYEAETGDVKWYTENAAIQSSPAASETKIFYGDESGMLTAIGKWGRVKWKYHADSPISTPVTVDSNAVYFTTDSGRLYGIDENGGELFTADLSSGVNPELVPSKTLYVPLVLRRYWSGMEGTTQWTHIFLYNPNDQPATVSITVYSAKPYPQKMVTSGDVLGVVNTIIPAHGRYNSYLKPEWAQIQSNDLYDGQYVAGAIVDSDIPIVGYNRYRMVLGEEEDGPLVIVNDYNLISTKDETLYAPLVVKNWPSGNPEQSQWSSIILFNPNPEPAEVTFYIYSARTGEGVENGELVKTIEAIILPYSWYNSYQHPDWSTIKDLYHTEGEQFHGTATIKSTKPIVGQNRYRVLLGNTETSPWILINDHNLLPTLDKEIIVPIVLRRWPSSRADGSKQWTSLHLFNPNPEAAEIEILIYSTRDYPEGQIKNGDVIGTITKTIPAFGLYSSYMDEDWESIEDNYYLEGQNVMGTGIITSSQPIIGQTRFRWVIGEDEGHDYAIMDDANLISSRSRYIYVPQVLRAWPTTNGPEMRQWTSLMLFNPGEVNATVTVEVFSGHDDEDNGKLLGRIEGIEIPAKGYYGSYMDPRWNEIEDNYHWEGTQVLAGATITSTVPITGINRYRLVSAVEENTDWNQIGNYNLYYSVPHVTSPAVDEENVYATSENKVLVFDKFSGEAVGSIEVDEQIGSSVSINGQELLFTSKTGKLYSATLAESSSIGISSEPVYEDVYPTPHYFDGKYIAAYGDTLYVDQALESGSLVATPLIGFGKNVISASRTGEISAYDLSTGQSEMFRKVDGAVLATPAIARDKLFIATSRGYLYALGKEPGSELNCLGVQHCTNGVVTVFAYCGDCTGMGCSPGYDTCPTTGQFGGTYNPPLECVTYPSEVFFFDEVYPINCDLLDPEEP